MTEVPRWLFFIASVLILPVVTLGLIRKIKARLQNRIGAPVLQPLFDWIKLSNKNETISKTMSWVFRSSAVINLAVMLMIAIMLPWLSYKPICPGADLFLIIYLFAMARMSTILAALDSGSAFGAFGASREATLALLVEPASVLSLAAAGALCHTSDLNTIFSFSTNALSNNPAIWLLIGTALVLASLVELSRMPVDDPTTHLELTMVHEAMILEASGRNLALIEYTQALRMTLLFGLSAQCYMRAIPTIWTTSDLVRTFVGVAGLFCVVLSVAIFESVAVKLQWRKVPEFIAYSLTMSFLAAFLAASGGILR